MLRKLLCTCWISVNMQDCGDQHEQGIRAASSADTGKHLSPGKAPSKHLHLLKDFLQHDPKTTVLHLMAFSCTTQLPQSCS